MKAFLRDYGGTIILVAILVILLAPYLGVRFGTERRENEAPPQRDSRNSAPSALIRDEGRNELTGERAGVSGAARVGPASTGTPSSTNAALGEIEALLKK